MNAEQLKQVEKIAVNVAKVTPGYTPWQDFLGVAWEAWAYVEGAKNRVFAGIRRALQLLKLERSGRNYYVELRRKTIEFFGREYDPAVHTEAQLIACFGSERTAKTYLQGRAAFRTNKSVGLDDWSGHLLSKKPGPSWDAEYYDLVERLIEDVECNLVVTDQARERRVAIIHERAYNGLLTTEIEAKYGWSQGTVSAALKQIAMHVDWSDE